MSVCVLLPSLVVDLMDLLCYEESRFFLLSTANDWEWTNCSGVKFVIRCPIKAANLAW